MLKKIKTNIKWYFDLYNSNYKDRSLGLTLELQILYHSLEFL